ncbi:MULTISPECIES: heme exporter protein CcmD [unclassified Roseovarius]|uniref:heme exporter protein CcmD n=1 Tax=unclassified Roseovarius TaxID=2614913 RepID=UPI00273EBDCD|nr:MULTISPECIES: heme exporter protein CcmD [unclassified Roseovarius]
MMPELGKYADTVLSAYAVSILLILGLVAVSLLRAGKVKKQLQEIEDKVKNNG